jgi:EmrB/QacA subfamily drug resistance transporter
MADQSDNERLGPEFVKLAAVLLVGFIAPVLDLTIVNVALATIGRDLQASVATVQWVMSAFLLAFAMVIPISGWAMGRFGGKRLWLASLGLFLVGSVLCALSWNMDSLIAFRVVQGASAGLMLPVFQNLIVEATGGRALGRAMALATLPALIGPMLGPVVGGLIIGHLNWHWIFWVNVPFAVAGLLWAWRSLPADRRGTTERLDVLGLVLLSPAVAAMIYGLTEVATEGGFVHSAVLVPIALGLALLAAFVFHALYTSREPLIDLRLFSKRSFSASTSLLFLSGFALYGGMLLMPLYFQEVRGQSALAAGLLLAPQGAGVLLTRGLAGRLTDRMGARPIVLVGLALMVAGTFAYTQAGLHTSELLLACSLIVRGAGIGMLTIPVTATAYLGLSPDRIPHATSTTRLVQQIGGSFGAAVIAVILQTQMVAHANGSAGRALAFGHTFWWSLGLGALALVPALLLPSYVKPQKSLHLKAAGDDPAGRDVSAMLEPQDSVEPVDEGGADRSLLPMANSSVGSLEEGETQ